MSGWAEGWLQQTLFGISAELWLWTAAVVLAVLAALALTKRLLLKRLPPFAARTATELDDLLVLLVRRTRVLLAAVVALGLAAEGVLPGEVPGLRTAAQLAFLLQLALWGGAAIDFWVDSTRRKRLGGGSAALAGSLRFVGKVVLWALFLLLALDNLGVDITTLVAGLGVGGVALALATQNILGDLFASLSIAIDKPFVIGDTIGVGDFMGRVESVGLKTTRLRSVSGEQLVFANGDLLQSRLRNFERMSERRVVLTLGLSPATPPEALGRVPGMVRELVEGLVETGTPVRFDRAHLKALGVAAFDVEVVYWVLSADYTVHMDVQQAVLLGLAHRFQHEGIALAAPTPPVVVALPPGGMIAPPGRLDPPGPGATSA